MKFVDVVIIPYDSLMHRVRIPTGAKFIDARRNQFGFVVLSFTYVRSGMIQEYDLYDVRGFWIGDSVIDGEFLGLVEDKYYFARTA